MIHPETYSLLDRMIAVGKDQSFSLDKKKAEKNIHCVYDLFDYKAKRIEWVSDPFLGVPGKNLKNRIRIDCRKRGGYVRSVFGEINHNRKIYWASGSWAGRTIDRTNPVKYSKVFAISMESSIDHDFDYFIDVFNRAKVNNKNPNRFIISQFLFLEAKEAGAGFILEDDGTAYVAPRPIIRTDNKNRYHSLEYPAIEWLKGPKFYFLHGVRFTESLWRGIVGKAISANSILRFPNVERREVALKLYGWKKFLQSLKAQILDERLIIINGKDHLHQVIEINQKNWTGRFLRFTDPSDGEQGVLRVDHNLESTKTVAGARAYGFRSLAVAIGADQIKFERET